MAEKQYPRREWHSNASSTEGDSIWPQITGDFFQTLKECESLLVRHGRPQNGRMRVLFNINWWLTAEGAVDNLRAKLRFHISKVELYAKPSEFEAIIRQGRDIQQLRKQLANLERVMIHGAGPVTTLGAQFVTPDLNARFAHEFDANRPSWFSQGSDWPLKEGFEALIYHYGKGTVKFNPMPEHGNVPEIQEFLNLAKAVWVFQQVKESQHYQSSSTEPIWADYMRELEDDLRGQLHRFETGELVAPSAPEVLGLSNDLYTVSKGEENGTDILDAAVAGPPGEQLLQLALLSQSRSDESSLAVFRESDDDFLFVISTKQMDTLESLRSREFDVSMDRHRLVPIYGAPLQGHPLRNSIMILNERGKRSTEYAFHNADDVKKLQRALTGYRVHHDMPLSSWRINGSEQNTDFGGGALQLWQYKALPPMVASTPAKASDADPSLKSPRSPVPSPSSVPTQEYTELASSKDHNQDLTDFVGWYGFPSTPFAEVPSRRQTQTSSFTELASAQWQSAKRSSYSSYTNRYSDFGSSQLCRLPSKTSNVGARSNSASQATGSPSSTMSEILCMSHSSVLSPVRGHRHNGIEALKPEPPVLIIFTFCNEKYSYQHLTCKS